MGFSIRATYLASAAALLAMSSAAQAAPVTFFGEDLSDGSSLATVHPNADAARNSFFSNLNGVGTETFESYSNGTPIDGLQVSFPGAGTATLAGAGFIETGPSGSDQFPISGTNYIDTNGTFSIAFGSPISAFGFYGTDLGDAGATLTLTLTGSNGVTTLTVPDDTTNVGADDGSALYFGFYDKSNTFSSVSFSGAGSDVFGFDDFSIGSNAQVVPVAAAPEPAAWTTMILGFGLAGRALRRRGARSKVRLGAGIRRIAAA